MAERLPAGGGRRAVGRDGPAVRGEAGRAGGAHCRRLSAAADLRPAAAGGAGGRE